MDNSLVWSVNLMVLLAVNCAWKHDSDPVGVSSNGPAIDLLLPFSCDGTCSESK